MKRIESTLRSIDKHNLTMAGIIEGLTAAHQLEYSKPYDIALAILVELESRVDIRLPRGHEVLESRQSRRLPLENAIERYNDVVNEKKEMICHNSIGGYSFYSPDDAAKDLAERMMKPY